MTCKYIENCFLALGPQIPLHTPSILARVRTDRHRHRLLDEVTGCSGEALKRRLLWRQTMECRVAVATNKQRLLQRMTTIAWTAVVGIDMILRRYAASSTRRYTSCHTFIHCATRCTCDAVCDGMLGLSCSWQPSTACYAFCVYESLK